MAAAEAKAVAQVQAAAEGKAVAVAQYVHPAEAEAVAQYVHHAEAKAVAQYVHPAVCAFCSKPSSQEAGLAAGVFQSGAAGVFQRS